MLIEAAKGGHAQIVSLLLDWSMMNSESSQFTKPAICNQNQVYHFFLIFFLIYFISLKLYSLVLWKFSLHLHSFHNSFMINFLIFQFRQQFFLNFVNKIF